jgi:hypothetical protein
MTLIKPGDLVHNNLVVCVLTKNRQHECSDDLTRPSASGMWLRAGKLQPFIIGLIHISGCHMCQAMGLLDRVRELS